MRLDQRPRRTGSAVFSSTGEYDGTTASGQLAVVTGSGTGDFATVRGTGTTSATKEQVDYVLELELGTQLWDTTACGRATGNCPVAEEASRRFS